MPKTSLLFSSLSVFCYLAIHIAHDGSIPEDYPVLANSILETPPFQKDESNTVVLVQPTFKELADSLYVGKFKKRSAEHKTLSSLFVEWGATAPKDALAYLENAPRGIQRFSKSVLRGWAQTGVVDDANTWVVQNIGHALASPFYEAIVNGLHDSGKHSLALKLIQSHPGYSQPSIVQRTFKLWARKNQNAAAIWIEKNMASLAPEIVDAALSGYAIAWTRHSPTSASEWALTLPPGSTRSQVLYSAVDKWIQIDADAAGTWLLSQDKTEAIEHVLSNTAHQISHLDPEQAFDFISKDPQNHKEPYRLRGHMIMALDNLIRKNPSAAGPWIERVEQDSLLGNVSYHLPKESYVKMISRWAALDETSALKYLVEETNLSDSERTQVKENFFTRLETSDPKTATYHLLKTWADLNQTSAAQFESAQLAQDNTTTVSAYKRQYVEAAKAWAQDDPTRIRYFVERQQFLNAEETATLLLAFH